MHFVLSKIYLNSVSFSVFVISWAPMHLWLTITTHPITLQPMEVSKVTQPQSQGKEKTENKAKSPAAFLFTE